MADEDKAPETTEEGAEGSKSKGGLKTIIIVAALMIIEGAGVFFLVSSMGGPAGVEATELQSLEGTGEEAPVEIELVTDRFQNMQTGRVWEWRVSIFLKVRQKNVAQIAAIQERDAASIKEGVAMNLPAGPRSPPARARARKPSPVSSRPISMRFSGLMLMGCLGSTGSSSQSARASRRTLKRWQGMAY